MTLRIPPSRLPLAALAAALMLASPLPAQFGGGAPALIDADPVAALSRYLRMLASNPRDLASLTRAGRAALAVGDANAALGFYARAEEISPRNGRIKAGLAAALVQMEQPRTALKLFDEAVALGVPIGEIAADRGLAHDLNGDGRRAQADYTLALRAKNDDETIRRLALSMAISGDRAGALTMLAPLLRRGDSGAVRARAFVLALTGDQAGAAKAVQAAMPGPQGSVMASFLARLVRLNPAQKALAVNFGYFPSDGRSYSAAEMFAGSRAGSPPVTASRPPLPSTGATASARDTPLIPSGAPIGQRVASLGDTTAPRRRPGETAAPAPIAPPAHVLAAPIPGRTPIPAPVPRSAPPRVATVQPVPAAAPTTLAPASASPAPQVAARAAIGGPGPSTGPIASAATPPAATPAPQSPTRPASGPSLASATPAATTLSPLAAAQAPARLASVAPLPSAIPSAAAQPAPVQSLPTQPSAAPAAATESGTPIATAAPATPAPASVTAGSATPLAAPPAASADASPPAAVPVAPASTPSVASADPAPQPVAPAPAPGGLIVSPAGPALAATRTPSPVATVDLPPAQVTTARPRRESPAVTRRAAAVTPFPAKTPTQLAAVDTDRRRPTRPAATASPPSERAKPAANDKKADTKPKADAKPAGKAAAEAKNKPDSKDKANTRTAAKAKEKAPAKEAKPKVGERYWVQVASGANKANLDKAWSSVKGKAPQLLEGKATYTAPWRASNRLLVGPFKSEEEAQAQVNKLAKAGVSGIQFTTRAGVDVEKVSAK